MRLLNTSTLQFKEFYDSRIPPYAILSHRWGDEEVTYKEWRKGTAPDGAGTAKIRNFCRLAAERKLQWCWIDTCCIDKRSSAELTEAINSMWKWYENAKICMVHLSDVTLSHEEQRSLRVHGFDEVPWKEEKLRASSWFTRGWTLQELLAPTSVIFYYADWEMIAPLSEIIDQVSQISKIDKRLLEWVNPAWGPSSERHAHRIRNLPVAERLSWMAARSTTREEDMSYCLLGLFNVNMPLLYGEGGVKAFKRLQIEIMSASDDESLFAWWDDDLTYTGMLAPTPRYFAQSADVLCWRTDRSPYALTQKGLMITVPKSDLLREFHEPFPVFLRCSKPGQLRVTSDPADPHRAVMVQHALFIVVMKTARGFQRVHKGSYAVADSVWNSPRLERQLSEDLKDTEVIYVPEPEQL